MGAENISEKLKIDGLPYVAYEPLTRVYIEPQHISESIWTVLHGINES